MDNNKTRENSHKRLLPLLSRQYSNQTNKFSYKITHYDIEYFNQSYSLSQEMIEYCFYDLLASEKYKERQGMRCSYIIFDDCLNNIVNHSHRNRTVFDLKELIQRTCFYIPTYDNNDDKWSLVIMQNIHLLFYDKYREMYKDYHNHSYTKNSQSRIIFISASHQTNQLINVIEYIERLFVEEENDDNDNDNDQEDKQMIDKDKLNQVIEENTIEIQLPTITESESALLLVKTIFGGIKSINIDSYINTLLNNNYDLEEIIKMKTKFIPELKYLFQSMYEKTSNENYYNTITTRSKGSASSKTKANIPHPQHQPLTINKNKQITMIHIGDNTTKSIPLNQSKKPLVIRAPSITIPSHRVMLTETDIEPRISMINKLDSLNPTDSNDNANDNDNEYNNDTDPLQCEIDNYNYNYDTINQYSNNENDSQPNNAITSPVKYKKQVCQTEPIHMRLESWPLTPKHEIKEIKLPIIKQNLQEENSIAYKNKMHSRNKGNYLNILLKDSSMLSYPSERIDIEKFDLESMRNMAHNHKIQGVTSENEEEILPRNYNLPRKSNRKPLDSKSTLTSNNLISVRDYSTNDIGNDGLNNKDGPSNPCNNCGDNNCLVF